MVKRTYGSTEAPTVTTGHAGDDPIRLRDTDGRPTGDVRIHLGPADELWVRGPELFVGYTDPARTAEAIGARRRRRRVVPHRRRRPARRRAG